MLCFPVGSPWLIAASTRKMTHLFSFAHRLWADCSPEPKTGPALITRVRKSKHNEMPGEVPKP